MRAASCLCWLSLVAACGGRGLADSIHDEGDGEGGRASTASGGANLTSGGRRSSGGVTGAGGRVTASGGAIGSGGAATTPPESCRRFCKELVADCGIQLQLNDTGCRSSCEEGFSIGSSACDSLRIEALDCVEKALAQPMTGCADFSRIISEDCRVPLFLSLVCGR